eukprot:SAG22_NODE_12386_length_444_cov_2.457971_1_plen_59_part_00
MSTCAQKLNMNERDLERHVAISASPGTCFNYYPEPVEDGEGALVLVLVCEVLVSVCCA